MVTSNKYLGYNTYILGTTKNVIECLDIVLYNKGEITGLSKISLYNIDKILNKVIDSGKFISISRNTSSDSFNYSHLNNKISGFDTIIYLNLSKNPIGYTEFINIQGKVRSIEITLNFNSEILGNIELNLTNSLRHLRNNNTIEIKDINDYDLNKFSNKLTIKSIIDNISEDSKYNRYTKHLSTIAHNKDCGIYLNYGFINNSGTHRLYLSQGINIDPYEVNFTNHQIGYFKNDIVIYSWIGTKYSISSLTKKDVFLNPIIYTDDTNGFSEIKLDNKDSIRIKYFSGRFAILVSEIEEILYDIIDKKVLKNTADKFIFDLWDIDSRIINYPRIINYSNVSSYFPEIFNCYLDIEDYTKTNTINIINKIGDWFILYQKHMNTPDLILLTNMDKVVFISVEELKDVVVINNKIIAVKTITTDISYYTYFIGSQKIYYSEKALRDSREGSLVYDKEKNIYLFKDSSNTYINKQLYEDNSIIIDKMGSDLLKSFLFSFRKYSINPKQLKVPNIMGSINGLIFYKTQNILNFI